jgi:hypothetical protein
MNIGSALAVILFDARPSVYAAWFIFFSLMIGSANLIPFRNRAMLSDGKRILLLLRPDGRSERWLAMMQLGADQRKGIEARDFRPDLIAQAIAVCDDSPDTVMAHVIAYAAAWDRSAEETAEFLETSLRYSNFTWPQMQEAIFSDAGVFQARKRKRPDLAREWLADLPSRPAQTRLRIEAAILEIENDIEGALNKLDEIEKAILKVHDAMQKQLSLKGLQRWRSELLAKSEQPVADS